MRRGYAELAVYNDPMRTPTLTPDRQRKLLAKRLCDLGLAIPGSRLEAGIKLFQQELKRAGIVRLQPDFYLSMEWGVPTGSISIAIPFWLSRAELIALHAKQVGFLEGAGRRDLLRYLRHEMGHVVNYAYRLFEQPEWSGLFGAMATPYEEEYRLEPFCSRYVQHLPGWYAQKHPDEDWAETFGVWLTPKLDWRTIYAAWPDALAKLEYCERTLLALRECEPEVTALDRDEDATQMTITLQSFYETAYAPAGDCKAAGGVEADVTVAHEATLYLPGLDGALEAIFEDVDEREDVSSTAPRLPAGDLIRRLELDLVAGAYRWSGYPPERARALVHHLARRADALQQVYPADRETEAVVAVTTLVMMLAMNHVVRGSKKP